jgi:DNA adenine methylase
VKRLSLMANYESFSKPILKWVGGKSQILSSVLETFPKNINNYHEPFIGGGSVLIGLLCEQSQNRTTIHGCIKAYDFNETLINMYINLRDDVETLINELTILFAEYNSIKNHNTEIDETTNKKLRANNATEAMSDKEKYYYWCRDKYNNMSQIEKNSPAGSAIFIYMNRVGFRGMYRESVSAGKKSVFNIPFGNYKTRYVINKGHYLYLSELFANVEFIHRDCEDTLNQILKTNLITPISDFVYLDPPYLPIDKKSFTQYIAANFNEDKHRTLFNKLHELSAHEVLWVMSNADVPMLYEYYPENDWGYKKIVCSRRINSKNPGATAKEVIIYLKK